MRRILIACFCAVALLAPALTARAEPATSSPTPSPSPSPKDQRVQQARDGIRSSQESKLIQILVDADSRRAKIEETLVRLQVVLDDVQRKLFALRMKVIQTEVELDRTTLALTDAQNELAATRTKMREDAAAFYMRGTLSTAFTLMNAEDMAAVASAEVYMETVLDTTASAIHRLRIAEARLIEAKRVVEERKRALEAQEADLEKREAEVLDLLSRQERSRHQLIVAIADRADALAELTGQRNGYQTIVRSFDRGHRSIAALIAAAQEGQPVAQPDDRELLRPVPGAITSRYGWRIHPIYHYRSFHTGVDLAAKHDEIVTAARDGVVLAVDYVGAYGLVTLIDHGSQIATMYAHMSRSAVGPGETVKAGEPIGLAGCTGWCTGPHVHFEVWFQAKPQNPVYWF